MTKNAKIKVKEPLYLAWNNKDFKTLRQMMKNTNPSNNAALRKIYVDFEKMEYNDEGFKRAYIGLCVNSKTLMPFYFHDSVLMKIHGIDGKIDFNPTNYKNTLTCVFGPYCPEILADCDCKNKKRELHDFIKCHEKKSIQIVQGDDLKRKIKVPIKFLFNFGSFGVMIVTHSMTEDYEFRDFLKVPEKFGFHNGDEDINKLFDILHHNKCPALTEEKLKHLDQQIEKIGLDH